jgi:hypothetical protein
MSAAALATDFLGRLFDPLAKVIDNVHTSTEEKLTAQRLLFEAQAGVFSKVLDYEARLMEAQASIIKAEAAANSWLTRTWRPITMMVFLGMVLSWWLGYTPPNVTEALVLELFGLIKIGLGGYVIGRSAEKIAPALVQMVKGAK